MDWKTLRVKFEGRRYKVGYQKKEGRRLGNCTYAFLYNEGQQGADTEGYVKSDERVEIELFTKPIIIYYPDGMFQVDNHGYWRSQCTRERFAAYLPGFSRISSWSFRSFETYTSMTGEAQYAWAFHVRDSGSKIWSNTALYDARGHRKDLPDELNTVDANDLLGKIRAFATASIGALYKGDLDTKTSCATCMLAVNAMRQNPERDILNELHILKHVLANDVQFPLVWLAAAKSRRPMHTQAVDLLLRENYPLWKPARSSTALAERVQRTMLQPGLAPTMHPSHFRKTLRWNITSFLLEAFGFSFGSA